MNLRRVLEVKSKASGTQLWVSTLSRFSRFQEFCASCASPGHLVSYLRSSNLLLVHSQCLFFDPIILEMILTIPCHFQNGLDLIIMEVSWFQMQRSCDLNCHLVSYDFNDLQIADKQTNYFLKQVCKLTLYYLIKVGFFLFIIGMRWF